MYHSRLVSDAWMSRCQVDESRKRLQRNESVGHFRGELRGALPRLPRGGRQLQEGRAPHPGRNGGSGRKGHRRLEVTGASF